MIITIEQNLKICETIQEEMKVFDQQLYYIILDRVDFSPEDRTSLVANESEWRRILGIGWLMFDNDYEKGLQQRINELKAKLYDKMLEENE